MCQFPDKEITLKKCANHLFLANLKVLCFLEQFYPCLEKNARNSIVSLLVGYENASVIQGNKETEGDACFPVSLENTKQQLKRKISSSGNWSLTFFSSFHFSLKSLRAKPWISNAN